MTTQVELYNVSDDESKVFWLTDLDYKDKQLLKRGQEIVLTDNTGKPWIVAQVFITVTDSAVLPPKSRKATIFCFLEEDASAKLSTAYPPISVN